MGKYFIAGSKSDRSYTIDSLKRQARSVALQAARATPTLAAQLKSLAESIEAEARELETAAAE
jgi:hypothetical protein